MNTRWTRSEIRAARKTPLKPLLEQLGYRLSPTGQGNYALLGRSEEVVVKDHYWVRLQDGVAGNAIDFLVKIHGMSFAEAMQILRAASLPRPS